MGDLNRVYYLTKDYDQDVYGGNDDIYIVNGRDRYQFKMISRSVGTNATYYTNTYPDKSGTTEGIDMSQGLKWSDMQRCFKYVVVHAHHSAGELPTFIPVNLIPLIAKYVPYNGNVPTAINTTNFSIILSTKMYTSTASTTAQSQLCFALVAIDNQASDYYVYTYIRNNSNAARNMNVFFVN